MLLGPDIVRTENGPCRYRVYVDGGVSPNGVGWEKTLPAKASAAAHAKARKEMNEYAVGQGFEPK